MEEQKSSKKKHLFWIIPISIFLFIGLFLVLPITILLQVIEEEENTYYGEFDEKIVFDGNSDEKIVVLKIEGQIGDTSTSFFDESSSFEETMAQLHQVKEDPSVKGVVVEVDSPGGSVSASDKIYREILEIKENGKKVVVSMGDTAASGGYYISAPADKIYAMPYTLTGSLGVIMTMPNYEKLAEKIGYDEIVIKSGALKDIGSTTREMTEEEKGILQTYVNESYEEFVRIISEGRNMPEENVRTLADGRIYSGKQALQNGLVDEMGDAEEAIYGAMDLIGTEEAMVVTYEELPVTFSDLLFGLKQSIQDPIGTKALWHDQSAKLQYLWKN